MEFSWINERLATGEIRSAGSSETTFPFSESVQPTEAPSVDQTDAREATVRRFGRPHRSKHEADSGYGRQFKSCRLDTGGVHHE
jgi:hypothetical protein